MRMEMLVKCWRKLKKMLTFPDGNSDHHRAMPSVAPSRAVQCDELFLTSGGKKKRLGDDMDVDPLVAAHLAAQRHFSLRPNIFL